MDPRSALSDVPPEVFCKIFALASGGQSLKTTQGLWAISSVCSHWRSVALSDPTLWARLQINLMLQVQIVKKVGNRRKGFGNSLQDYFLNDLAFLDSDREEVEEVDEIVTYSTLVGAGEDNEDLQEGDIDPSPRMRRETTRLSEGAIAALREHLTRSQSVPLYVNVSVPSTAPPTTPCLIPFIELLLSQSHRFKQLSTDIPVSLITPDYKNLGCVRHLKTHIPPSFAFETLSLPAMTACHFLIEGTSTPPLRVSEPKEKLENLRELVLESQNPIHAQDLQVPISALQLPTTLASLTIRNLALSVAVVRHLPETQEMYIVKEPKAYMAYLPEDVVVALINTIERRLDHGLLRSVSVLGFTVPKLDRSVWHRIEVLNARDNVAVKFISLWR